MPAVPETKATWTDSVDPLNSTNLHAYLRDPLKFLMNKPLAQLRQTAVQSVATAAFIPVTFGVEDLDDDPDGVGGHSTASNTSRYTARYPGWYLVGGGVSFAASATARRGCRWAVNGAAVNGSVSMLPATAANETVIPARTIPVFLDVGDYVELQAYQNSGVALNTNVSVDHQSSMTVSWDRLSA